MEVLKSFAASPELVYFFYRVLEEPTDSSKTFGSTAHALSRFVLQAQARLEEGSTAWTALWGWQSAKSKGLELLHEREPPAFDELYAVATALEALRQLSHSLATLSQQCPSLETNASVTAAGLTMALSIDSDMGPASTPTATTTAAGIELLSPTSAAYFTLGLGTESTAALGAAAIPPATTVAAGDTPTVENITAVLPIEPADSPWEWVDLSVIDRMVVGRMVSVASAPLLTSLTFVLSKSNLELQIQYVLQIFQSFSNTCGRMAQDTARDACLSALCRFTLPDRCLIPHLTATTTTGADRGNSSNSNSTGSSGTSGGVSVGSGNSASSAQVVNRSGWMPVTVKNVQVQTLLRVRLPLQKCPVERAGPPRSCTNVVIGVVVFLSMRGSCIVLSQIFRH